MATNSVWDTVTATIKNGETTRQVMTRILDGQATVKDMAALANEHGDMSALRACKLIAARDGLPHVRRLVTEYGHTVARHWATMC
ncbi:hypothetical protein [Streptomyces celluloflavus]|uniref:hypothetical protein n=1 Tax=Streptomyces celluloflavus TaxID=58344 RepID=UPI0036C147AA